MTLTGGPMLSPATTAKSLFCGSGCPWQFNATTLYASAALSATWHSRVQEINFKCFFCLYFFFNVLKLILSYFLALGRLQPRAIKLILKNIIIIVIIVIE